MLTWWPVSLRCVNKCSWRYVDQTYWMSEYKHHLYNEMRTSLLFDDKAINGPTVANDRTNISSERTELIFNWLTKGESANIPCISLKGHENSFIKRYHQTKLLCTAAYMCCATFLWHLPFLFFGWIIKKYTFKQNEQFNQGCENLN